MSNHDNPSLINYIYSNNTTSVFPVLDNETKLPSIDLNIFDEYKNRHYCLICGDSEVSNIEISYAFKLILDEFKSLCIYPKLNLKTKTTQKGGIYFSPFFVSLDIYI